MFSGRHKLAMKGDKVFVDRDPRAFKMMVDFIRNNGKLYEEQEKNFKMLQIELEFWGIDEKLFKQKNQVEMIQEIFDKPIYEIFDQNDSS